ncbi:MAG: CARDB domain-containing protein [Candidatus Methanomethylicaceae archaeon]
MKSKTITGVILFCAVFAVAPQAQSATLSDIVGVWPTRYNSSLKISGLPEFYAVTYGYISFYDTLDFLVYENAEPTDRFYWGTFYIEKGKRIIATMEVDQILQFITDWISSVADEAGYWVENVTYEISYFNISPCKINNKKISLGDVKMTMKGTVSAEVNGIYEIRSFLYNTIIKFGPKSNGQYLSDLTGEWQYFRHTCTDRKTGLRCRIEGLFTIRNTGAMMADEFSVEFSVVSTPFYGSDEVPWEDPHVDVIKLLTIKSLEPGSTRSVKVIYHLPVNETAFGRYMAVLIDAGRAVKESDETNNRIIVYISVT